MGPLSAVLIEPVGCLADFPAEPFHEIAVRLYGRRGKPSRSASRTYWHLVNLMQASGNDSIEGLEVEAVDGAILYGDVLPALDELKAMGVKRFIASSLSNAAITTFLAKCCPHDFDGVWNRDNAAGIKAVPLRCALNHASLQPVQAMFLTDTAEGLKVAESVGINSVLMMNDPDESQRLAMLNPGGGIVSLHELADFIRLVEAANARSPLPG
jgi:beta-phosphoglucomutase-like phosphatase (HAD superfamily)